MHTRFIHAVFVGTILLVMAAAAFAQVSVGVVITIAPPPLPIYDQPLCPGENYIWTPGYWAYGDDFDDYYWVPGTWVLAPQVGFLWTPGYWEWNENRYVFYDGYWGPQVGFYGGIFYGFGYFGEGYEGGRWDHDRFFYNTTVNNVNITEIHNVYNAPVRTESTPPRVSYHGGNGGINRPPKPEELAAARARHIPPVPVQREHVQVARTNPDLRASANMGKPPVAATPKPGAIKERGVVPAKAPGGPYTPPPNRGKNQARENAPANRPDNNASRPNPPVHARDLPPADRPSPPNTGNAKQDQKYQQQQEKQFAKQEQERQKLQQKQEREDQRVTQQKADNARKQQVEQRHQQQTQQLQQRHEQQQRQMQQKQQPQQKQNKQPPPDRNKPPH